MLTATQEQSIERENLPREISLSVVIPVFESEAILPELLERLAAVLPTVTANYEVILVNDGSRDNSWLVIESLAAQYDFVKGICLMRNYGQQNALLCGIRAARYLVTITMDDDLQHPPEEIPKLIGKLTEGYDLVYGSPRAEQHGLLRDWFSIAFKSVLAHVMHIPQVRGVSSFRAFRTTLRDAFANFQSPEVLLDTLFTWGTANVKMITVRHDPRRHGKSNYSFGKLFNQAILVLTGFSTASLRFATLIGLAYTLLGLIILVCVFDRWLKTGGGFTVYTAMAAFFSLFGGAQLFAMGIIGEYIARIFSRSSERPPYVVSKIR